MPKNISNNDIDPIELDTKPTKKVELKKNKVIDDIDSFLNEDKKRLQKNTKIKKL